VPKRYNPEGVREAARRLFDTLFNSYRFFTLYANAEDWSPNPDGPATGQDGILDRWIRSRLHRVVKTVSEELDGYQITRAYRLVVDFLNEDLSNWYVRRSRARFWGSSDQADTQAAFETLSECLRVVSLLLAPVAPFVGDWIHRALVGTSAHLARFPVADPSLIDDDLETEMGAVRSLVSLGRAAREEVHLRVRQPLSSLFAVLPEGSIRPELVDLLKQELNVKSVEFLTTATNLVSLAARPNFRALGPRFGKSTNLAAQVIGALSPSSLEAYVAGETVVIDVEGTSHRLEAGDFEIVKEARGDLVVKSEGGFTAALDPSLTDELISEGLARELVNRIQRLRKDSGLDITDRIRLRIDGPADVQQAAKHHRDFIVGETLALALALGGDAASPGTYDASLDVNLDGRATIIELSRVKG
jgi:isoleucyl-tRNA synthetase